MKPKKLNEGQIRLLATLARQAYIIHERQGLTTPHTNFDDWRHAECRFVCERTLSEALRSDFEPLEDHFRKISGQPAKQRESGTNALKRRQMLWRLDQSLSKLDKPRAWALEIARDVSRDPKVTWQTLPLNHLLNVCRTVAARVSASATKGGEL